MTILRHKVHKIVYALPRAHDSVAEIGMLVKGMCLAAEFEGIFVVAFDE